MSAEEFRLLVEPLGREELLAKCMQLHSENEALRKSAHSLRSQLAAVALRAEEEDERTVLRLTRELEKKAEELRLLKQNTP